MGVDPTGIRMVLAAAEEAEKKKLAVVAGPSAATRPATSRAIKRIHDGAIGELTSARVYWNGGRLWAHNRQPDWSDIEYQIRNWYHFLWLSGDHIVEQHVHNLDVVNWAMSGAPVGAYAMGSPAGRDRRDLRQLYDHFVVEFWYPNGARTISTCRQTDKCSDRIGERVVGTKGVTIRRADPDHKGKTLWQYQGESPNPYVVEHADLVASIRGTGPHFNEAEQVAESTLAAIMGRMMPLHRPGNPNLLGPEEFQARPGARGPKFGPKPVDPIAKPGETPLI